MAWPAVRKFVVYGPLLAGLALLVASRASEALREPLWTATALFLIGGSCLLEAVLKGGGELTDEQIATLRHLRIPYREGMERKVNFGAGVVIVAAGLWFALG